MDREVIQDTRTRIRAGDPSDGVVRPDALGGQPYCFRLKNAHPDGAHAAIAPYKPWWRDLKQAWNREIDEERVRFKRWTQERATATDKTATHVAMNGGRLCVPQGSDEDAFLVAYAKCLLAGHRMYFVEQLTYAWSPPCFRLFMDLDFKQLQGITERGIEAASVVCHGTVEKFFPTLSSHCIVASTTYKTSSALDSSGAKVSLVKTGVHLYWPNFFVTPLMCLHIRESIISNLTETFGPRKEPAMNLWDDVVDKSVYGDAHGGKGSGLRMLGSCKTDACPGCKGRGILKSDGAKCTTCHGDRRVNDMDSAGRPGRPYMMLCVIKAGSIDRDCEKETFYMANMLQLVLDTKLRTTLTESRIQGFELPKGAPLFLANLGRKRSAFGPAPRGERAIEPTDPMHLEIQNILRTSFGSLYDRVVVRRVTRGSKQYTVNITGINCRYCQNIGREHVSNNIYFVISKDGVVQRCYDTGSKTAEMRHGICKEYSSGTIPLSASAATVLWPEANDTLSVFVESTEGIGLKSFAMQALLRSGEYLATLIHNTSWTATLGLQSSKAKRGLKDFVPQDPRDLGARGIEAYKDLGLSWADSLMQLAGTSHEEHYEQAVFQKTIVELERALVDAFDTLVVLAATSNEPETFACAYMDDFCLSEVQEFDDDILIFEDDCNVHDIVV